MANIYYDQDANLELITDKTVAIIGYGNQGRSQALNMRDSGVKHVIVGSRHDESFDQANEDGFMVYSIEDAAKLALAVPAVDKVNLGLVKQKKEHVIFQNLSMFFQQKKR